MKKILITGNSGYIGSHLCKMIGNDYEVHGLDINDPIIPVSKFYEIDIRNPFTVDESYDAVIHLAALANVGESMKDPIVYYNTNITGTINVLNAIPTKNFIFASTGQAELCVNPYGMSKRAAEDCVVQSCSNIKDYTMFRFYNVVGIDGIQPTNKDSLLAALIKAKNSGEFTIFGDDYNTPDGTCLRDYVHVNEICTGLIMAIEDPANGLETLGHGTGTSVRSMVDIFKKVNNVEFDVKIGPRKNGDPAISVLSNPGRYMKNLYQFEDLMRLN